MVQLWWLAVRSGVHKMDAKVSAKFLYPITKPTNSFRDAVAWIYRLLIRGGCVKHL